MSFLRDIIIPIDIWDSVVGVLGEEKARLWFFTANPMLGDVKPTMMIALGRTDRLRKAIKAMCEGNNGH